MPSDWDARFTKDLFYKAFRSEADQVACVLKPAASCKVPRINSMPSCRVRGAIGHSANSPHIVKLRLFRLFGDSHAARAESSGRVAHHSPYALRLPCRHPTPLQDIARRHVRHHHIDGLAAEGDVGLYPSAASTAAGSTRISTNSGRSAAVRSSQTRQR